MSKGLTLALILVVLIGYPAIAQAQPEKVFRIGLLHGGSRTQGLTNLDAFRQALRELGYVEGKNVAIEERYAEGKNDRLPELAAELVRLKVDILVANTSTSARAAKKATTTTPIVMVNAADPIESGLVASLARPGGNVTGMTNYSPELLGKRLEVLKDAFPKVRRVGILYDPTGRATPRVLKDTEKFAPVLGLKLQRLEVRPPNPDFEGAFRSAIKEHTEALVVSPGTLIGFNRIRVIELAAKNRLPAIYPRPRDVEMGGLMAYGTNVNELWRRAAYYVDRILKGTKPADLPVEQPMKFELVINLKTAKQIGLTIPQSVLYRADKMIK